MKKNLMSVAVAATLVGASAANAVFVNPEGHGQALIYPFYTVEGGHDTYINLVNTTDQVKAVKVRFLEAMNSREVLDFNLYLSPYDHWSAVVFPDPNGAGAAVRTADTSCTVPNRLAASVEGQPGLIVPFRNSAYQTDTVFKGLDRTREGYVEIIEMGVLTDADDIADVTHVNGLPKNCATLEEYFQAGGKWRSDQSVDVSAPTGGLYGYGVLINVQEGTNATYDAVALDQFVSTPIHNTPGNVLPSLSQATPLATVFDSAQPSGIIQTGTSNGIDAVSAVLMHSSLQNDYVLEPDINAGTDWVVTFPTKNSYVNGSTAPLAPFTDAWDATKAKACEPVDITYFDREERDETPDALDFSPAPEGETFELCREANLLTFNNSDVLAGSERVTTDLTVEYDNGWLTMDFNDSGHVLSANTATFRGLPAIGFAVQKYVNGALEDGTKSNYAGVVNHRGARDIVSS